MNNKLRNKFKNPYLELFLNIPKDLKIKYVFDIFLVTFVGILEFFSLSSVLFFAQKSLSDFTSILDSDNYLIANQYILILVILLFCLKTYIILLAGNYSYKIALDTKKFFQDKIFSIFLRLPFNLQANNSSSDWIRILTVDLISLEGRFFTPVIVLFGEIIPSLCICIFLIRVNYQIFIFIFLIFLLVGSFLLKSNNKKLVKLGEKQQSADGAIVSLSQQAYSGIKELRIYNLRQFVFKNFKSFSKKSSESTRKGLFLGLVPRFAFEFSIYSSLGLLFIIYEYQGKTLIRSLAEILVFATAAIRLLPSVSKIISYLQSLKYAKAVVKSVVKVLSLDNDSYKFSNDLKLQKINFESLSIRDLSFSYEDIKILDSINLEIISGEKIAIIGPSGSGKTTFMNLALGLLEPSKGKIFFNNKDLLYNKYHLWNSIGYVPQEPFLFNRSIQDNITLLDRELTKKEIQKLEELIFNLDLPEYLFTDFKTIGDNGCLLSGGQKQRLSIARAIWRDPEILFLDESTSSLDLNTQKKIMNLISNIMFDKTIIMISHRLETIKDFDKIFSLPEGELKLI